jgi:histidinol-phosphate/aromatic aminotransferase/cobyric acid decarboxylase-like protein
VTEPSAVSALPAAGRHGDDAAVVAEALGIDPSEILDLAQTMNPVAPDWLVQATTQLDALTRYPDERGAHDALADALDCDPQRLVLTNGGAEAIALVAAVLEEGWVDEPDFALYRRHLARLVPGAGRWRSNPHSPSGRLAARDERAAVWDEAFWPLTTGSWTRGDADTGSFVVGSLTKLFACPGLRIGYVLAPDDESASAVRARKPRWSVNALACALVPRLVDDADLPRWAAATRALRDQTADELRRRGVEVDVVDAPWMLVRRRDLRAALARHRVLVRDCASFGLTDTYRIATPRERDLPRLLQAFDRALADTTIESEP